LLSHAIILLGLSFWQKQYSFLESDIFEEFNLEVLDNEVFETLEVTFSLILKTKKMVLL
jgi:hypothetical protein